MKYNLNNLNARRIRFVEMVVNSSHARKTNDSELIGFLNYWTETNERGYKMRWEREEVFSINRRLATFAKNKRRWNEKRYVSNNKIINIDNNEFDNDKL